MVIHVLMHGYVSSIYTIAIGSIGNTCIPIYEEPCTSKIVALGLV